MTTPSTRRAPEPELHHAVVSTGAAVARHDRRPDGSYGPWTERLDIAGADLSRLVGGPVLLDHVSRSHAHVGTVEAARIENGRLIADLRFGESLLARDIARDVRTKIRTQLSVGYAVHEWERAGGSKDLPTFLASRWQPMEVSVTPLGADPGARFRSSDTPDLRYHAMTLEAQPTPDEAPAHDTPAPAPAEADGIRAERARAQGILLAARKLGLDPAHAERLITAGTPLDAARAALIDLNAARQADQVLRNVSVVGGRDHADPNEIRARMAGWLAFRLGGAVGTLPEGSREYAGASMLDLARGLMEARGIRVRASGEVTGWLFGRSGGMHTTSDFALLMGDGANRALLDRFQRLRPALAAVARYATSPDFRTIRRIRLGEGASLEEVSEHGEITRGTTSEQGESYAVKTYAKIYGFTRKLIVNDDLGALQDFLNGAADAASGKLGDVLADVVTTNPTLSDGVALYHSTHGNVAASGTAIDVTNLGLARKAMRSQTGIDGTPIQVTPRFLVVGAAQETAAEQVLASITASTVAEVNPFSGRLTLVVEPRLSGNAWYLFAEPGLTPVLEYAELDGSRPMGGSGPSIETRMGFDVEGIELKCRYDVGAGAVDYRGSYKNAGQ